MADLEAVLADVSYLMAMEKSKATPAARASKRIVLPEPRYQLPRPAPARSRRPLRPPATPCFLEGQALNLRCPGAGDTAERAMRGQPRCSSL